MPNFYRPDVYLLAPGVPGAGTTPFEAVAHFVFALVYLVPLVGMLYAHCQGSRAAKCAACLTPLCYHAASVVGALYIFPHGLNAAAAPLSQVVGTHAVMAVLLVALFFACDDAPRAKSA